MAEIFDAIESVFSGDNNIREFKSEDNGSFSLATKAVFGAAATTGILLGLGRSGSLRYLSDKAHLLGRSLGDAATKFNNESPFLSRLATPTGDLVDSFRSHFSSSLAENADRMAGNALFNGKTYAERIADNAQRFELSISKHMINNKVADNILSGFKDEFASNDTLLRVHNYVSTAYRNKGLTGEDITKRLMDDFSLEEGLSSKISDKTREFMERNVDSIVPRTEIDAARNDAHKKIVQEFQNVLGVAEEGESSFLTGYKKATLGDLMKADDAGQIKLGENQKKFFQEVIDNAYDEKGHNIGSRVIADNNVFVDGDGKLTDLRTFTRGVRDFAEEYSDTMPAKIFHIRDVLYKKDERVFEFFGRGASNPAIAHLVNKNNDSAFLNSSAMHIGKHIYDTGGNNLDSNHSYRLLSSEYGTIARALKKMFGLSTERERDKVLGVVSRNSNPILKNVFDFLDIGNQESASDFERVLGLFRKKNNPDWDRNVIDRAIAGKGKKDDFDKIATFFDRHVSPLTNRTWHNTMEMLNSKDSGFRAFDLSKMSMRNSDEIEKALEYFSSNGNANKLKNDRLKWILKQYGSDPYGFLNRNISVSTKVPVQMLESITKITGYDVAKREIQKEILLQSPKGTNYHNIFKMMKSNGQITGSEAKRASQLFTFAEFDDLHKYLKTNDVHQRGKYVGELNKFFISADHASESTTSVNQIKNMYANVFQSIAFNDNKRDKINTQFFSLRDDSKMMFGLNAKAAKRSISALKEINNLTKAKAGAKRVGSDIWQTAKELTAGRHRPQDITAATVSSYFYMERLNELIANVGLGLSDKSLKSPVNAALSIFGKRIFPVIAGMNVMNYLDYRAETYTGTGLYSGATKGLANFDVGIHKLSDIAGITKVGKSLYDLLPQWQYLDENGVMTAQEQKDHYLNGYDPVRRGRFWELSSSPWAGEGIEYWRPTNYRLITSNYKYTDTLYGSKKEYWANNWMPTPAHPFAPIKHFLTDRYHWEKKHEKDRPYPYTSALFEEGTPWGAILNPTLGQIIKPVKKMHSEEFNRAVNGPGILASINNSIKRKAALLDREKTSSTQGFSVAVQDGSYGLIAQNFVPDSLAQPGMFIQNFDYRTYGQGVTLSPDMALQAMVSGQGIMIGGSQSSAPKQLASSGIAGINQGIKNLANGGVAGTFLSSTIYSSSIRGNLDKVDASELYAPNSIKSSMGDLEASFKDISGIWGFFYNTATDTGVSEKSKRIANAGSMTSMRRSFWDQALGGIGGDISELGRRFIPRPNRDGQDYNPLRNTMPTWMPTKFRTGDPYTKIKKGEARLPGSAYETLNTLHSDMFGRYGAFDRFKVLADVAPYSEEYRLWKSIAERTVSDSLKPEMQKIKHRVSLQNKKHRFFSYKFKYSDVHKQSVTVAAILDNNTFLSHELPDTPIKFAGVDISGDGSIQSLLQVGQAVDIAFSKDKGRRYNQDTYHTLNAVVYSNNVNLNRKALDSKLGTERNDDSPAGIHAKYSQDSIFWGKAFEGMAHWDNLFNNKLLKIRSPYEEYERTEVYGKPFTSWQHPIDSYVIPAMQRAWSKGPIGGALKFGTFGAVIGAVALGSRMKRIKWLGGIGAAIGFAGGLKATISDLTGKPYIPERVQKRREIEEYFDKLKYAKYRGLYERARQMAWKYDGISVENEIEKARSANEKKSSFTRYIGSMKKRAYIYSQTSGIYDDAQRKEKVKQLNEQLKSREEAKQVMRVGKYTMAALMYRQQMESTMFGLQKDSAWMSVIRAMPRRDREYFTEFVSAPEAERKKILKIVSKQQAEILKNMWGMKEGSKNPIMSFFKDNLDKNSLDIVSAVKRVASPHVQNVKKVNERVQKDLELAKYFSTHALPGKNWDGWEANQNLDAIKIKVMDHYGVDVSDAGYTQNDLREAKESAPPAFDIFKTIPSIQTHITQVLAGAGLNNVTVVAVPTQQSGLSVKLDMLHNTTDKIKDAISSILF